MRKTEETEVGLSGGRDQKVEVLVGGNFEEVWSAVPLLSKS